MTWLWSPLFWPLSIGAIASFVIAINWWRNQSQISKSGALLLIASGFWIFGSALEVVGGDLCTKLLMTKIQYIGICFVPPLWFILASQFSGHDRWLIPLNLGLLLLIPALTFFLAITNELHGLIWKDAWLLTDSLFLSKSKGVGFILLLVFSYLVVALGLIFTIITMIQAQRLYRWQAFTFLITVLAVALTHALLDSFGYAPNLDIELTPFVLAIVVPPMIWGLIRLREVIILPVAKDTVIENMRDGLIVLNLKRRIVDINPAARQLLNTTRSEIIGERLDQLSAELADLLEEGTTEPERDVVIHVNGVARTYNFEISPLLDQQNQVLSRILVLRDITERVQTEEALRKAEAETRRRLKEQIALREAGAVISSSLDQETILFRIAEEMGQAIDATSDYINSYELTTGLSTVIAEYIGPGANDTERLSDLGIEYLEDGGVEFLEIMKSNQHEISHFNDTDLSEYEQVEMQKYGIKTILYIPLRIREQLIGYTELWDTRQRRDFSSEEITLCRDLAQQAAIALENARLYDQARQEIEDRKRVEVKIRESLQEKEALLREVHHRVKNNLQVIISLLNLQLAHIKGKKVVAAITESQNRIRSMAFIHEQLYQADSLSRIDFGRYIRNLTAYLFDVYRNSERDIKLSLQLDSINLDMDTAIPCGLIINELVTNALRHAFRDGASGRIDLQLWSEPGDEIHIRIRDDGVGLPSDFDSQHSASLGVQLVQILSGQLDGRVLFGGDNGTVVELIFHHPQQNIGGMP